jgi:predicted  nucleic acid-binding Zn-ribbon protein
MSWLQPSASEQSVTDYFTEMKRLQKELDRANEDIDDKLDRLNTISFDQVKLTQELADERARNTSLEDDLTRMTRRDERRLRRLEKVRCHRCHTHMDLRALNRVADGDER